MISGWPDVQMWGCWDVGMVLQAITMQKKDGVHVEKVTTVGFGNRSETGRRWSFKKGRRRGPRGRRRSLSRSGIGRPQPSRRLSDFGGRAFSAYARQKIGSSRCAAGMQGGHGWARDSVQLSLSRSRLSYAMNRHANRLDCSRRPACSHV